MKTEPVRLFAALLALGASILLLFSFIFTWSADLVTIVNGVWSNLMAVFAALYIRDKVTPVG